MLFKKKLNVLIWNIKKKMHCYQNLRKNKSSIFGRSAAFTTQMSIYMGFGLLLLDLQ